MRKLILTCDSCGQRMQVPRSAMGRTGLCPACGATVKIRSTNTAAEPETGRNKLFSGTRSSWWRGSGAQPSEDAKRKFGEAVDLYYSGRFAEALAIFDGLARQFPGNPDIESGRIQCISALKRPQRTLALEDRSDSAGSRGKLDEETIRGIVLEKLLHGHSESVQLQAAEIACRLLGLFDRASSEKEGDEAAEEPAEDQSETEADEEQEDVVADRSAGANGHDQVIEVEEPMTSVAEENEFNSTLEQKRKTGSTGFYEL